MRIHAVSRTVGYVRVSGAEQGRHGTSLEAQQEAIKRYCESAGYPAPRIYVEVESAGAEHLEHRAEIRALLGDVRPGDLVITTAQDRWSRDTLFFLESTRSIASKGARFFSIAERFDPGTPDGRFAATIMAAVAEQERERIRSRTVGRRKELRDQGFYVEGPPPFGYRRENRRLVICEEEAAIVREVFRRCILGASLRELSEYLQVEYPDLGAWDRQTVHSMLRRRAYLGEHKNSRGVWFPAHDAIVTRETFERARKALTGRKIGGRRATSEARTNAWLLRRLATCGDCGARMSAAYGSRADYYACRRRLVGLCSASYVAVQHIDPIVGAMCLARLRELRSQLAQPATRPKGVGKAPAVALARLGKRRERAIALAVDGTISPEELRRQLASIEAEVTGVEAEMTRRSAQDALQRADVRAELLADVGQIERAWEALQVPERREVLRRLARVIKLGGDEPAIEWTPAEDLVRD